MQNILEYNSPLGKMLLSADEIGLNGVWFYGQKYFARNLKEEASPSNNTTLTIAKHWLDIYFSGTEPDFLPPLNLIGSEFQKDIWNILKSIPYGQTTTYGIIAKQLAKQLGLKSMSSQAVGGAVGHNPLGIIIPCHRVIGTNNCLTGYAGGIDKKIKLLQLEGIDTKKLTLPKNFSDKSIY